jgi:hypothetical protein
MILRNPRLALAIFLRRGTGRGVGRATGPGLMMGNLMNQARARSRAEKAARPTAYGIPSLPGGSTAAPPIGFGALLPFSLPQGGYGDRAQEEIVGPRVPKKATRWDRWILFKIPGYKGKRTAEYIQDVIAYEMYHSDKQEVREYLAELMSMRTGVIYDPNNPDEVYRGATQYDYREAVKGTEVYRSLLPYLAARTMHEATRYIPKLPPGSKDAAKTFMELMTPEKLDEWLKGSGYE